MTPWTTCRTDAVGDRITTPNPLRWDDRALMWLGFKRWSTATARWECVDA